MQVSPSQEIKNNHRVEQLKLFYSPAKNFAAVRRYPGEWSAPDIDSSFVANPK
jgi:hypothetical protein